MANITIKDLKADLSLDRQAMSAIRGAGGAPWVYGWITPFAPASQSIGPAVNFTQVNNSFQVDKMVNQFQTINIANSGAGSNINAVLLNSLSA